jgi:hypothetical protein
VARAKYFQHHDANGALPAAFRFALKDHDDLGMPVRVLCRPGKPPDEVLEFLLVASADNPEDVAHQPPLLLEARLGFYGKAVPQIVIAHVDVIARIKDNTAATTAMRVRQPELRDRDCLTRDTWTTSADLNKDVAQQQSELLVLQERDRAVVFDAINADFAVSVADEEVAVH